MNQFLLFATDANSIQAWVSIAQLLITLGTVVLIVSTFRLQAETFREQQKITKIEQERIDLERKRSKNAALPVFKINYRSEPRSDSRSIFKLDLDLQGNMAIHVIFKTLNKSYCYEISPAEMLSPGDSISIPLVRPFEEMFYEGVTTLVTFTYFDFIGNEYEQLIWLSNKDIVLSPQYDVFNKTPLFKEKYLN